MKDVIYISNDVEKMDYNIVVFYVFYNESLKFIKKFAKLKTYLINYH